MKVIDQNETRQIGGGVVFGPSWINGYSSYIVMLKDDEDFYYYDFNKQTGYFFKNNGSIFGSDGPVAQDDYRTFINQTGYRSFFIDVEFFE